MKWIHFIIILLLDFYFKINGWIYRDILRVLVKNSLNLIIFSLIPSNFGGMKIWDFKEKKRNECSLLPVKSNSQTMEWTFHSLNKNSQTREVKNIIKKKISLISISFHSFPLLKYIPFNFISFYSILFTYELPNKALGKKVASIITFLKGI